MVVRIVAAVLLVGAAVAAGVLWSPVGGALLGAAGVAGAAVARGVWKWHHDRIVRGLAPRVAKLASRFDDRYRGYVRATARFVDVKGLATMGFATPELDDVYVDVALAPRELHSAAGALVGGGPDAAARRDLAEFLDQEKAALLAIVGPPGSGKTTLLRHTARVAAGSRKRKRPIPVLVVLREHAEAIKSGKSLAELITSSLGALREDAPPGWAEHHLRSGRCLVLCDGLDEVARVEDRKKVATWVERQSNQYPGNDFVVTSRPQGYREATVTGAHILQTLPFTDTQVRSFVRGWYLAVERLGSGEPADELEPRATASADDLLARLKDAPALLELTPNPLLLTMIANVHRFRGALPGTRADLYREMCEVALWRRNEAKDLAQQLSGTKRETVLRALAYRMMEAGVQEWPRAEVLAEFRNALRRFVTEQDAEQVLADVTSNGLLVEQEKDRFAFAHLTFQEFLAAAYVRDSGLVGALTERVDDSWWRETILLHAAMVRADEIVEACLMVGTATAIRLAFDCADNDADLDPALRKRLTTWLNAGIDDRQAMRERNLRAQVLVAQYLRDAVPLSTSVSLCHRPMPAQVVSLSPVAVPAHGVSSASASALARWADLSYRDRRRGVRLPRPEEIADPGIAWPKPPEPGPRAAWVQEPGGVPFLWCPDDPHPHLVTGSEILAKVDADLDSPLSVAASEAAWELRSALNVPKEDWHFMRQLASMPRLQGWRATDEPAAIADLWAAVRATTFEGWRGAAHAALRETAEAALDPDRAIEAEAAREVRLLSLILARSCTRDDVQRELLALASAVTLLEARASGADTETVHLALEKRP